MAKIQHGVKPDILKITVEIEIAREFRRGPLQRDGRSRLVMSSASLRAWMLFGLVPMMLLQPAKMCGVPSGEMSLRDVLINSQREDGQTNRNKNLQGDARIGRGRRPEAPRECGPEPFPRASLKGTTRVDRGWLRKQKETLAELQRTRKEQRRQIFPDVLEYRPGVPLSFGQGAVHHCIAKAVHHCIAKFTGERPSATRLHQRNVSTFCTRARPPLFGGRGFCQGETPASRYFLRATMTALSKKDGGIRGITTGSSFRRLVGLCTIKCFVDKGRHVLCWPCHSRDD